ncbi:MAG: ABC transporter substrate-binding protein [Proteobacteria bacterium]|nr:ABC transporter substrate-binding protein [Pseudomonadota bacterium]
MKNRNKLLILGLAGICMVILLAGLAMAAEKVDEIPIGMNLELTGGLAASTIPASYALLDYFKYINDQGGFTYTDPKDKKIHRAKYKIMWADNGFSVARSMTNVKRFIDRGAKAIFTA